MLYQSHISLERKIYFISLPCLKNKINRAKETYVTKSEPPKINVSVNRLCSHNALTRKAYSLTCEYDIKIKSIFFNGHCRPLASHKKQAKTS